MVEKSEVVESSREKKGSELKRNERSECELREREQMRELINFKRMSALEGKMKRILKTMSSTK